MNDISSELAKLHILTGADFIRQLKLIVAEGGFHAVEGENGIFSLGGEQGEDYDNQLNAARKAVTHGYQVYLLPNPNKMRSADFILVQHGIFKMYDLKTIFGKSSVMNRLKESVGQANHILLNMATDYNATSLARCIKKYFELNPLAMEVMIFKGTKVIVVTSKSVKDKMFFNTFTKRYNK